MGRTPCCDKVGLKKGPWTAEEDEKLAAYISRHGHGSWRALPKKAGLLRCGKSCRLRWTNYLRPDIKRGEFTALEEQNIIQLHALLGNRWSAIAAHLSKRTDNEIKNYWNTHLKRRLLSMGLDPATHKPKVECPISESGISESANSSSHGSSSIFHMAQWESARLEAEARLARESALRAKGLWPAPSLVYQSKPSTCDQLSSKQSTMLLKQDLQGEFISSSASGKRDAGAPRSHCKLVERNLSTSSLTTSADLVNSLQNWENSLQGQAGLMWPNSWRSASVTDHDPGQQESSSCSSAQEQRSHDESPTSTLCSSFDVPLTTQSSAFAHSLSSAGPAVKLSWSDITWQQAKHSHEVGSCSNDDTVGSRYLHVGLHDGLQAVSKVECSAEYPPSLLSSLQGAFQLDSLDTAAREVINVEGGIRPVNSASSSLLIVDHELELAAESMSTSESSLRPIKILAEDDLDHYWDNLLVAEYSPRQMVEALHADQCIF